MRCPASVAILLADAARMAVWRARAAANHCWSAGVPGVAFNLVLFLAVVPLVVWPGERLPEELAKVGDTWADRLAARTRARLLRRAGAGPPSRWTGWRVRARRRRALAGLVSRSDDGHWQAYTRSPRWRRSRWWPRSARQRRCEESRLAWRAAMPVPVFARSPSCSPFAARGKTRPAVRFRGRYRGGVPATGLLCRAIACRRCRFGSAVNVAGCRLGGGGEGPPRPSSLRKPRAPPRPWAGLAKVLHAPQRGSFRPTWPLVQPFTNLGSLFGLCTLAGLTAASVFWSLTHLYESSAEALSWWALVAVTLPFVLRLREERPWLAREGLYALGLTAIAIALNHARLSTGDYLWNVAITFAPYMAFTAALVWTFLRHPEYGIRLGITRPEASGASRPWFNSAESLLAVIAAALSVWISFAPEFSMSARLAGPFATAILAAGFVFLAETARRMTETTETSRFGLAPGTYLRYAAGSRHADGGGNRLGHAGCHRSHALLAGIASNGAVHGGPGTHNRDLWRVAPKLLPVGDWADSCRRAGPVLAPLRSRCWRRSSRRKPGSTRADDAVAPMTLPAVIVVALALLASSPRALPSP